MTCVAKVTVPEPAAVPPVFLKVTVTRSHHRRSPSARTGAETVSRAGRGAGVGDGEDEEGGAVGGADDGPGPPVPGEVPGAVVVEGVRVGVPPPVAGAVLEEPEPPELPEPPGAEVVGAVPVPVSVLDSVPEDPEPPGVPGGEGTDDEGERADEDEGAGAGDDVLDVVPLAVGLSRGTSVTAPEGATAPLGEGPAPTAAYPSPSPPPPQAVSAPPRQSATATSPGFLRLMGPSLADGSSVRRGFPEVRPRDRPRDRPGDRRPVSRR